MAENTTTGARLVWIDWMKTIAMYFIIVGHMFLPHYEFIYVFSVLCFFVISGFLSKKENDARVFWNKLLWNMIVPMFLLFFIEHTDHFAKLIYTGAFKWKYLWQAPILALSGMQGEQFAAGGLYQLWFVYTLILCKIVLQYLPSRGLSFTLAAINTVFIILSVYLHEKCVFVYSSFVNVLLAMPFFTIGFFLRPLKERLSNMKPLMIVLALFLGLIIVWICGKYNDPVMLYRCDYGSSVLLCLLGGTAGTVVVYSFSILLGPFFKHCVSIIGGGTLIILALHPIALVAVEFALHRFSIYSINHSLGYFHALFILLIFVPVIMFVKRYFPILYGKQRN